jgi:hypothetical protein
VLALLISHMRMWTLPLGLLLSAMSRLSKTDKTSRRFRVGRYDSRLLGCPLDGLLRHITVRNPQKAVESGTLPSNDRITVTEFLEQRLRATLPASCLCQRLDYCDVARLRLNRRHLDGGDCGDWRLATAISLMVWSTFGVVATIRTRSVMHAPSFGRHSVKQSEKGVIPQCGSAVGGPTHPSAKRQKSDG